MIQNFVPNKEVFAEFSSTGEIAKSLRLMQRDLEGTWENCRHVLANVGMGALNAVGELGGSLPLTFEGQPTDPQLWAVWLRGCSPEGLWSKMSHK